MNLVEAARRMTIGKTAVLRAVWLVVAVMTFGLLAVAVPLRYQMFLDDAYGYGAPLAEIGLSLRFFAIYFTFFELLLVGGSWAVGVVIAWRKSDDWFALLTAVTLLLFVILPFGVVNLILSPGLDDNLPDAINGMAFSSCCSARRRRLFVTAPIPIRCKNSRQNGWSLASHP
jgi:hypothetical protein